MTTKILNLGEKPRLLLRSCCGKIRIQGREEDTVELLFRGVGKAVEVQEPEELLEITSSGPVTVHVPVGATVTVEGCACDLRASSFDVLHVRKHLGDVRLKNVTTIEMTTLHGDARVETAQALLAETLYGDLRAQSITEKVSVVGMHGDISLQQISGQMDLQSVTGDLSICDPDGQLDVHDINGDVRLEGNLQSGQYKLQTSGDVMLRLAPTSNAHLELAAPLGDIRSSLDLGELQEAAHELQGTLGKGTAEIQVTSLNGDIAVRQLRHDSREEHAHRHAQRNAEHAHRRAERARHRAERMAHKAEAKHEAWLKRWPLGTRAQPTAVSSKDQESERLAVLTMLSEGKIDAEQAQALLGALQS